ncbi:hypothetical protein H0H81_007548 [Sphagnurus paluster]|uniref:Uncharacterized protein n=1 Tax=Sphagnurus paluster TaxID=117069 RepID=A0A9P7KLN7_9AGAR|nr:hypothetical protein H0H81_007548 [Sphagnurus paluster]
MSIQPSSIILPAYTEDVDTNGRVVRFDNECILIPERSKRPKLVKSYSLPLWKKRSSDSEGEGHSTVSRRRASPSTEDTHVLFKVPIPRFISRSPSRGRSTSTSPPSPKPLSPCLVNRSPSSSPLSPKALRRTSLPISTLSIPKDDAVTVPLRPCCVDCVPIMEESLREGEQWQEKFTRGARRRRSASLDNGDRFPRGHDPSLHTAGFVTSAIEVDATASSSAYRSSTFSITVDEVDKRRKSLEHTQEELSRFQSSPSSSSATPAFHTPTAPFSGVVGHNTFEKEASTSSTLSSLSISSDLSPHDIPPRRPKSSPIQEEDEDQLFPLPSPRRTPSNSPSPSANGSPSPSPNASTSCLAPAATSSKDSLTPEEGVIAKSLSRKTPESGLLQPSVLSAPSDRVRSTTSSGTITPPGEPSSRSRPVPISIPPPSAFSQSHSRTRSVPVNPPPSTSPNATSPIMASRRPQHHSPPVSSSPGAASSSSYVSPSSSPVMSAKVRRPSFSLPAIKDALKGAGVDVLKGVSAMGGPTM